MKLLQFYQEDQVRLGLLQEDAVLDIVEVGRRLSADVPNSMLEVIQGGAPTLEQIKSLAAARSVREKVDLLRFAELRLAPPITYPPKFLLAGANYVKHIEEWRQSFIRIK